MKGILFLAFKYIAYRPWRFLVLLLVVSLALFLPLALRIFVNESSRLLQQRAASTPLIVGPKGSSIDLSLNALYFLPQQLPAMNYEAYTALVKNKSVDSVPLHAKFSADQAPIVGTSLLYFKKRDLNIASGAMFGRLGECVIGADVARDRNLKTGESIISSPNNVFDLAGVYPLKMKVVGVLQRSYTPDDKAVFVDVKTTWVIEGLGHGHDDLNKPEAQSAILDKKDGVIRANASVVEFTEITEQNLASFHYHGDKNKFPITGILCFPKDEKANALLLGKYQSKHSQQQIVVPKEAIQRLTSTLFATQKFVFTGFVLLALATLVLVVLVFSLSFRLREREMQTYYKLGAAPATATMLKATEVIIVLSSGAVVALLAAFLANELTENFLYKLIL